MEVHNAGGGINFTVDHTRNATEEKLYELLEERLMRMLRAGSIFTIYQVFFIFLIWTIYIIKELVQPKMSLNKEFLIWKERGRG